MKAYETSRECSGPARFRTFLQAELARRCAANPSYSLRSFARHLDVDHSTLSQILRGKRPLTSRTIEGIAGALKLDVAATEAWIRLEESVPDAPAAIGVFRAIPAATGNRKDNGFPRRISDRARHFSLPLGRPGRVFSCLPGVSISRVQFRSRDSHLFFGGGFNDSARSGVFFDY